ncbi:hypothetical protein [Ralstonia pseudosolanacearum]|uniref:hypothetical protein n=1 Tax=Ralstonia pseudosolanacearum TaxID=1310165 RepID=UPI001FF90DBA|nr:hypothetical protein [Ralstonia pseudosolanacearum]
MSINKNPSIIDITCVIFLFIFALVTIVALMDLIAAPILKELFQDPNLRIWCGVFSRCASQAQISFFEYISMGELWNGLDSARLMIRLKKAALLGSLVGMGYVVFWYFRRRP